MEGLHQSVEIRRSAVVHQPKTGSTALFSREYLLVLYWSLFDSNFNSCHFIGKGLKWATLTRLSCSEKFILPTIYRHALAQRTSNKFFEVTSVPFCCGLLIRGLLITFFCTQFALHAVQFTDWKRALAVFFKHQSVFGAIPFKNLLFANFEKKKCKRNSFDALKCSFGSLCQASLV